MAGAFDYTPAPKARRLAIFAVLGTALLCILSLMDINLGHQSLSFLLIPTLAIYLWPQGANPTLSLVAIALVGFFLDLISFGPMGLWPLTWLILFLVYRPDARAKPKTLLGQWMGALVVLTCVSGFHYVLGRVFLNVSVSVLPIGLAFITAFFLFPFFYMAREYLARGFGGREEFYYESPSK